MDGNAGDSGKGRGPSPDLTPPGATRPWTVGNMGFAGEGAAAPLATRPPAPSPAKPIPWGAGAFRPVLGGVWGGQSPLQGHPRNPPRLTRRAAFGAMLAAPALGQGLWPERGVTIVVPFAPGSSSDIIARALAQSMGQVLERNFVVENRPGASGIIGTMGVIRSAPDGAVIMHAPLSVWAINVAMRPDLPYNPVTQLTRIMQTVRTPNVLVVNPQVAPVSTVTEFVAWLKRPGANAAYSSSGIGSSDHTTGALFTQVTGTDSSHVPYTGGGPATAALLAGNVPFSFQNLGSIMPQIRDGRVRALMVTSEARHPSLPDVPSAIEAGMPEVVVYSWQALGGPPGMAPALVARIHAEATRALRSPAVAARLDDLGFEVVASQPEDFALFQAQEIERWRRVVRAGNIRAE